MLRTAIVVAALFAVAAAVPIVDRDLLPVIDHSKIDEINSMQVNLVSRCATLVCGSLSAACSANALLTPSLFRHSAVFLDCRCQREIRWHDPP